MGKMSPAMTQHPFSANCHACKAMEGRLGTDEVASCLVYFKILRF